MASGTRAPSTIVTVSLNGQTDFNIPFEYLARKFVVVTLLGIDRRVLTLNTDYRFVSRTVISLANPTPAGYTQLELRRVTSATERLVDFHDGSILRAYDLNLSQIQTLHVAEEARDSVTADSLGIDDNFNLDARGKRIVNLAYALGDADAVPLGQIKAMDNNAFLEAERAEREADRAEHARTLVQAELSDMQKASRTVTSYGAIGDGVTDNTVALTAAITECAREGVTLRWPAGVYKTGRISVAGDYYNFHWEASGKVSIRPTYNSPLGPNWVDDHFIKLGGGTPRRQNLKTSVQIGDAIVQLTDMVDVTEGDLIHLYSNRLIQSDNRGQAREGQVMEVASVLSGGVVLQGTAYFFYPKGSVRPCTVSAVSDPRSFTLSDLSLAERYSQLSLTGTSGANTGVRRFMTKWSDTTKVVTLGGQQGGLPSTPNIGDTFEVSDISEVYTSKPCSVNISGPFTIERPITRNETAGNLGLRGLFVEGSRQPTISGITIHGFSETGLMLYSCIYHDVSNCVITGANRAYAGWNGTGYGVTVYQSSYGSLRDSKFQGCRRGVDYSGERAVSLSNRTTGNVVIGGGYAYDGVAFFPVGPTENGGLGSHGAGYETSYTHNRVIDCSLPFTVRGTNEEYTGNAIQGFVNEEIFRVSYNGGGVNISDNHYVDTYTEATHDSSFRYKPTPVALRSKRPFVFCSVEVGESNSYNNQLPIAIMNNSARALRRGFIRFNSVPSSAQIRNIYIGGNLSIMNPETDGASVTAACFMYAVAATRAIPLTLNVHDLGGNRLVLSGSIKYSQFYMYDFASNLTGTLHLPDNTWALNLEVGERRALDISTSAAYLEVSLRDSVNTGRYDLISGMIRKDTAGDTSTLASLNNRNVSINATPNESVSGKLSVCFSGGRLYLHNGLSVATNMLVSIRGAV